MIALLWGCGGAPDGPDTDPPVEDTDAAADAAVCARFAEVTAGLAEGPWSGDPATCDAGLAPQESVDGALAMIAYARELAGLGPVALDASNGPATQGCALLMHANDTLSHDPPDTWDCYTPDAAGAAGQSLLAREPALGAVLQYLVDFGNDTTLVHRRWLLNPGLDRVALGSTDAFSCLRLGSTVLSSSGWVAWPPPGRVPLGVLSERNSSVDAEGWSLQSDSLDLAGATVTVTHDGVAHPQVVEPLQANQGSRFGLRFVPSGFASEAGRYTVEVGGLAEPLVYDVVLVDCAP